MQIEIAQDMSQKKLCLKQIQPKKGEIKKEKEVGLLFYCYSLTDPSLQLLNKVKIRIVTIHSKVREKFF